MTFRIYISEAIFDTCDCVASAKARALTWAALLADETGQTVTCKVYRVGTPMHDALGRDCTPFFLRRARCRDACGRRMASGHCPARRKPEGRRMTAQELASAFRNGQLRRVANVIQCDGCRAIELAVLLAPDELVRLAKVVNTHADRMVIGGEARGGPVRF